MSYELTVKDHFDAAHLLRDYPGKCSRLHGHRWEVALTISVEKTDALGMGCDFGVIKGVLRDRIIDLFDHQRLDELPPFDEQNPTAENLARFVFERCEDAFRDGRQLVSVQVWEGPDAWVVFRPNGA